MKLFRTSAAIAAAALAGLALASTPAGATPNAPGAGAANSRSTIFAGYTVSGADGAAVTSASTAFTIPTVVCPATGPNTGVFLLADVTNATFSTFAEGGVFVVCDTGHLRLEELADINNFMQAGAFFPAVNDKITVSVSQTSAGARVIVKDLTQHKTQNFTGFGGSTGGSDVKSGIGTEAITMNDAQVGNPPFGSVTYSKDMTNGVAIGSLPHTGFNEATATSGGTLQILTSPLNAAGTSFKTIFKHT